jgi:hypothetical protein
MSQSEIGSLTRHSAKSHQTSGRRESILLRLSFVSLPKDSTPAAIGLQIFGSAPTVRSERDELLRDAEC